eukprot:CAMPEP_0119134044 /NCGR_PEP_ID=MMETSP1310-20130426/15250_1 /TAXON_ID=464262 /ORGANISM="Genus nov. species nov., Strain RCC2339" /LENGTH=62 /DNA_ID=CAMNT_0007124783 /DNA_START=12 /DNA_END=200 /DNA_ORIENTATION=+
MPQMGGMPQPPAQAAGMDNLFMQGPQMNRPTVSMTASAAPVPAPNAGAAANGGKDPFADLLG